MLEYIVIIYLSMVLFMTFVLVGLLEVHTQNKKIWFYVLIQPYGFIVFLIRAYRHIRRERACKKSFDGYRRNKKFKKRWY